MITKIARLVQKVTAAPRYQKRQGAPPVWRLVLCAFCASLAGIGLARFAYTPLMPAIINARWFAASTAAYLGAANLAGYLAGALLGRPISSRLSLQATMRLMMLLVTAAFFACAWPLGFPWFFIWRFAAGIAGGALMVLAAPAVLPHVPVARRGLAGGIIFMGVGVGVAASGTLVPLLLRAGIQQTWIGLGALCLLLTASAWSGWPGDAPVSQPGSRSTPLPQKARLRPLYTAYALNAVGWVPHMLFLVDFVARGLHQGIAAGAGYWFFFGVGATFGPVLAGYIADRTGFGLALRLAFLFEAVAVLLPALGLGPIWLILSSIVVGAFVTGTVPLVLGRIGELLPHEVAQQKAAWSIATACFALCQAGAAYGFSFLFNWGGGNYRLLFLLGAAALTAALAVDLISSARSRWTPKASR